MRKIFSIFFSVLIFAVSITVFADMTPPIISIICHDNIKSEETFDVYVSITEDSGVGGGRITIGYDNNILEVVSIEKGTLLADTHFQYNTAYTDSSLRVSWAGATNLLSGGNLFKITFKAKTTYANVSAAITVENMKLTDADTNVISGKYENKTLNVKAKDTPSFYIDCKSEVQSGETFDAYVSITENSGVGGGRVTIGYDNNILEVVSVEKETLLADAHLEYNATYTDSTLRVSWAGATSILSGGNLFKITFKAKNIYENVSTTITVEDIKLTDADTNVIPGKYENKTLNVNAKDIPYLYIDCKNEVQGEDIFDVYVSITEDSGVGGGRVTVGYDNNILEVVSVEKETLLADAHLEYNATYTDSTLRVSWADVTNIISGGNLFKITFKAKNIFENVSTTITVEDIKLTDADTNVIPGKYENKTLNVNAKDIPYFYIDCKNQVKNGEYFDVNINITDNSFACGGKFNLIYDNNRFEVVSTEFGEMLSNVTAFVNTNFENTIKANWVSTTPLTCGGSLLKVTFRVLDNVNGLGELTLQNCKTTDDNDITFKCPTRNKVVRIKCSTKTEYCEENGKLKFTSSIKGCPESAILFVALYATDGKMLDYKQTGISNELSKDIYLDKCNFYEAKVFVWESFTTLKPISDVEVLPYE